MASYFPSRGKIRAQVNINGQRESKTFDTKTEAKAWAIKREYELQSENGSARITFLELARLWVRRYPNRNQIDWEANRLEYLLNGALGETMLPNLSSVDVAKWRDERLKVNKPGTVLRDWNLLSSVCGDAAKEMGMLSKNPFAGVKRPETPAARDRLHTAKEMESLEFFALTRPAGAVALRMYKFACQTGMSAGECCALTWEQIDLQSRVVSLPPFKTRPARQIPLSQEAVRLLGAKNTGSVFNMRTARLDSNWRNLCAAANVDDLNFHDSRHFAATWLSKKIDSLALAKMLGHRDLRMLLNVYYKEDAASLVEKLG